MLINKPYVVRQRQKKTIFDTTHIFIIEGQPSGTCVSKNWHPNLSNRGATNRALNYLLLWIPRCERKNYNRRNKTNIMVSFFFFFKSVKQNPVVAFWVVCRNIQMFVMMLQRLFYKQIIALRRSLCIRRHNLPSNKVPIWHI